MQIFNVNRAGEEVDFPCLVFLREKFPWDCFYIAYYVDLFVKQ